MQQWVQHALWTHAVASLSLLTTSHQPFLWNADSWMPALSLLTTSHQPFLWNADSRMPAQGLAVEINTSHCMQNVWQTACKMFQLQQPVCTVCRTFCENWQDNTITISCTTKEHSCHPLVGTKWGGGGGGGGGTFCSKGSRNGGWEVGVGGGGTVPIWRILKSSEP